MLKKTLKITGITLVVLIGVLFLIPILFKNHITNLVKKEINNSVNAKVDFTDVSLSVFRHFPRISISLENLSIVGNDQFANDTLIYASKLDAAVNLFSVIKGKDIKVSGVFLQSPRMHFLIDKDGKANWDIAKASESSSAEPTADSSSFKMTLKKYEIKDGYIQYKDESTNMNAELVGLNHQGSGDFTEDVFTLSTRTKTNEASFIYANIPYLADTKTEIEADIVIDNTNNKYTFKTDDIILNNLRLSTEGFFQIMNDSTYFMDIKFHSPTNDFRDILSMVPAIYNNDFKKVKTSGTAVFEGFVKGIYSPQQMPAYNINLDVKDGQFRYEDLPRQVKNIQLTMHVSNPDGKLDNTIVDIPAAHLQVDNEPLDIRFYFKQPETAKYIDAEVKGKIDLSQVSQFMKLSEGTKLKGTVIADAFAKGNMSSIMQAAPFTAGGSFNIKNLFYKSKELSQPIQNGNMKVDIVNMGGVADNTTIDVKSGHIELGKDPVNFSLQVSNPLSTIDFSGTAKGRLTLEHLKQFMALEPGTSVSGNVKADLQFAGSKDAIDKEEYDRITANGSAQLNNIRYVSKDYPGGISITTSKVDLTDWNATLSNVNGNYLNSHFRASGVLNNLVSYVMSKGKLTGDLDVSVDKMDLNEWMQSGSTSTTTVSTSPAVFVVPADLDITINAKAKEVEYDKVDYRNVRGQLLLKDETVKLQDVKFDALEGSIAMNGSYSTKRSKTEPDIAIDYDINQLDVHKAFNSFNTVKALMPIGQFLSGKLSSQLSMVGTLDGQMMPALNSLTGSGSLLLIEGVLKKFAPLEKIASTLQIEELQEITIRDIKNYIEFNNGKVLVKPFNLKVKDIEMQVGGMHGFDRTMDYIVAMKLPRKYLGAKGNTIVDGLAAEAQKKGIPVKTSEIVNLNIKVAGSITNPSITTDLREVAGDAASDLKDQAKDFANDKVNTAKQEFKDTLNSAKKQVTTELVSQLLGKDTSNKKDSNSSKKQPLQTVKSSFEGLLKKKKKN